MDLSEIKEKKAQAETEIRNILMKFSNETGLEVCSISFIFQTFELGKYEFKSNVQDVFLEVKI